MSRIVGLRVIGGRFGESESLGSLHLDASVLLLSAENLIIQEVGQPSKAINSL